MAAILNGRFVYRGFEAWISVEGQPLSHFGVESNEQRGEATAWIPSEASKTFRVNYRKTFDDENGYWAKLRLDGHKADRRMHENRPGKGITEAKRMEYVEISPTNARFFMFNPIAFTDDDTYLDHPNAASIGEIRLVLLPANVRNGPPAPRHFNAPLSKQKERKVHEKDKRKVVHQIKLSETVEKPQIEPDVVHVEVVGQPVTFVFKYRPLEMLQADGIAPRPAPAPVLEEIEIKDSEDEGLLASRQHLIKVSEARRSTTSRAEAPQLGGTSLPDKVLVKKSEPETPRPVPPREVNTGLQHEGSSETKPARMNTKVKKSEEEDTKFKEVSSDVKMESEDSEDEDDEDEEEDEDIDERIVKRERILMAELAEIRNQKRARRNIIRRPRKKVKVKAETKPIIHFTSGQIIDLTKEEDYVVRPKKRVKRERKGSRLVHGEVIDLT